MSECYPVTELEDFLTDHTRQRPSKAITRVSWRPPPAAGMNNGERYGKREEQPHDIQLAVASEDNSLRIIPIHLNLAAYDQRGTMPKVLTARS